MLAFFLKDYGGSTSPNLLIAAGGIIIFLIVLAIVFAVRSAARRRALDLFFAKRKFTENEKQAVLDLLRAMKFADPLEAISHRAPWDLCSGLAARNLQKNMPSDEVLEEQIARFDKIRERLGYAHKYKTRKLRSSRALPVHLSLKIVAEDTTTQQFVEFNSRVLFNHDLLLGIAPPDIKTERALNMRSHIPLIVSFVRPNDAEYEFESTLVKVADHPRSCWFIQHSEALHFSQSLLTSGIGATLSVTHETESGEDLIEDIRCEVLSLNKSLCTFRIHSAATSLSVGSLALINMDLGDEALACNGHIDAIDKSKDNTKIYTLRFSMLTDKAGQRILKYLKNNLARK